MIGLHDVTVSSERAQDPFGLPINVNPYFTTDANGWVLTGGSGWATGGTVNARQIVQASGSRYAGPFARGTQFRVRALVTASGNRRVQLWVHLGYPDGSSRSDLWSTNVPAGTFVLEHTFSQSIIGTETFVWSEVFTNTLDTVTVSSIELFKWDPTTDDAVPVDLSCLVDDVAIQHGRDDPTGQPDASSATLNMSWDSEVDTIPDDVEIGARVEVATTFPLDWYTYAWTGNPDASFSTRTDLAGTVTNVAQNPTFRTNRIPGWTWSGATYLNTPTWVAAGGVDGGGYQTATVLSVPLPAPAPGTNAAPSFAELASTQNYPTVAGDVVAGSFYARPVGNAPGICAYVRTTGGGTLTRVDFPFVGTGWQRFTFSVPTTAARSTVVVGFSYRAADATTLHVGDGWDLDQVAVVVNPRDGVPPTYFDGSTPSSPPARYPRFVGRITDITYGWEDNGPETPDRPVAQVIATGYLADLGRRVIGDEPWPQELDGARVSRILALAGIILDPLTSDPGTVQILSRDIDSQPALDVAHDTAESASGIVWESRPGTVRYADAAHRRNTHPTLSLDACDVLVTPTWRRTTEGLVNVVSLGYGPTPEGGEQPRFKASDSASIAEFGEYAYTAETELATLADAQAMGSLLLARNSEPVWIMAALPVDVAGLDAARTSQLLALDMHDLLGLTGLPAVGRAPTSTSLWVEGWTERLAWEIHEIELNVSGFCRTAPPPRWDDLDPTWTWDTTAPPSLTWDDTDCLGPAPSLGRWNDVSANLRWDAVAAAVTWDTWDTAGPN